MRKRFTASEDRLRAARLGGAAAAAILGQFAVNMPGGYLGRFDEVTTFGLVYAVSVAVVVVPAILARLRRMRGAGLLELVVLTANLTVFLPAVPSDPVIAGAVVVWHLVLLGRLLFPLSPGPRIDVDTPLEEWLAENRHAVQHLLALGVVLTVTVVGFEIGNRVPAMLVCLVVDAVVVGLTARFLLLSWRAGSRGVMLVALPVVLAALSLPDVTTALAWLGLYEVVLLVVLLSRSSVAEDLLDYFYRRSALLVAVSFGLLIAVGTLFLSFPAASATEHAIAPVDALFTATSAVCVTGLIVLDTPTAFSTFGHSVILFLIQVGGLNIMVLSAFAAVILGRGLGLRGERALSELLDLPVSRTATQLAAFIVLTTLSVEAAGAGVLTVAFAEHGYGWPDSLWRGVFHSVSAFCNAGFALQTDSLMVFQKDPMALTTVALLIVLGGLGFAVLSAAWAMARRRGRQRPSVQVQLVLGATLLLLAVGTVWCLVAEWNHSMVGLPLVDKLANAFFQAVTPRTAGFNSLDLRLFQPATVVVFMVLMFIGASPGGTGGGIKTTTAAVLLGAIPAISRGESRVVLFRRTVPLETVYRSAALVVLSLGVLLMGTVALLATQRIPFESAVFEVFSALGTVGLSLGATGMLDGAGKLIIIAVMFVGRIGPLALALVLGRAQAGRVRYPDARIMVG